MDLIGFRADRAPGDLIGRVRGDGQEVGGAGGVQAEREVVQQDFAIATLHGTGGAIDFDERLGGAGGGDEVGDDDLRPGAVAAAETGVADGADGGSA